MNFGRLPFQFTTTDPVERQRELERRFGLPVNRDMYVDVANPLSMGAVSRDSNLSASSPRLQHRVPIFVDGYDHPIHSSVDSTMTASENKKPNVRVIPIEVEGAGDRSARRRTFSGPAHTGKEHSVESPSEVNASSPMKRSVEDLTNSSKIKTACGPRVHTIPIQVEGCNKSQKIPKFEKSAEAPKSNVNYCGISKPTATSKPVKVDIQKPINREESSVAHQQTNIEKSLQKIENVLEELKKYDGEVQKFNGTTKEKHYRYLDEMLTQCMIKLDDVDTMGNENVRIARKNAVKKVQAQLDLLESKANAAANKVESTASVPANLLEMPQNDESVSVENHEEIKDVSHFEVEMADGQDIVSESLEENKKVEIPANIPSEMKTASNEVPEVEMVEGQDIALEYQVESKKAETEVPSISPLTLAGIQNESDEVFEVEMAEPTTSENSNQKTFETQEVEMTDAVQALENSNPKESEILEVEMIENKLAGLNNNENPVEALSKQSGGETSAAVDDDLVLQNSNTNAIEPCEVEMPDKLSQPEVDSCSENKSVYEDMKINDAEMIEPVTDLTCQNNKNCDSNVNLEETSRSVTKDSVCDDKTVVSKDAKCDSDIKSTC